MNQYESKPLEKKHMAVKQAPVRTGTDRSGYTKKTEPGSLILLQTERTGRMAGNRQVIQCAEVTMDAIRDYTKKRATLPSELIEAFHLYVNRAAIPECQLLDKIMDHILEMKKQLPNQTKFNSYLTSLQKMLVEIGDSELDVTPVHYLNFQGKTVKAEAMYSFSGISIAERFNVVQTREFYEQISILKLYCNKKGMLKVIEGAAINVKQDKTLLNYDYDSKIDRNALDIFINRLKLMTGFIQKVGEEQLTPGCQIKEVYWIESTGSDPHQGGHHALFLVKKEGQPDRILYKPHSLRFEDSILGKKGLLSYINQITWFKKNKLPVMELIPDKHLEEFIKRTGGIKDPLDERLLQEEFYKLGLLEAVMKVAGITDLHCENIIFTKEGPVPIDAECGAAYGGTQIEGGTCLPGAVCETEPFYRGGMANPSALYRKRGQGAQFAARAGYQRFYLEGKRYMEKKIFNKSEKVLSALRASLSSSDCCRIVPISTAALADILGLYTIFSSRAFQETAALLKPFLSARIEEVTTWEDMRIFCMSAGDALRETCEMLTPLAENPKFDMRGYLKTELEKTLKALNELDVSLIRLLQIGEDDTLDPKDTENALIQGHRNTNQRMLSILRNMVDNFSIENLIDRQYQTVYDCFNSPNMAYMKAGVQADINPIAFRIQFQRALKAGTLPSFSLQLSTGNFLAGAIILENVHIGQVVAGGDRHPITDQELIENYVGHARETILGYQ